MGGTNLSDPKAAEEFARKLARQRGWRSVRSMGKGRFDVDYAVTDELTHDFTFPVIEGFAQASPFVQVIRHTDNTVRINAPAFSSGADVSPLCNLARMGATDDSTKEKGAAKPPKLPLLDGAFVVTTDGAVLANNTEEGPQVGMAGSVLTWTVPARRRPARRPR